MNKRRVWVAGFILLAGWYLFIRDTGLEQLKALCEKDAGLFIYKTVEAEGYYDASRKGEVIHLLIPSNYQFTEFCDTGEIRPSFNEDGCWRLTKVSREAGQCNESVDSMLMKSRREAYIEFRQDNCIEVKKIEKPEAKYRYEVERKEWWLNEWLDEKMSKGMGRIVNIKTNEVISESINYILKANNKPLIHCGSAKATGLQKSKPFTAGLIEKTIKPRKETKTGVFK
ncbi:MAG: hypothetical protein COB23_10170 [Methylophaga sp.]|nr:MAG: hypothetical protein COB23_10170 [Methylophaga sp.]